jgi:hypothetical protein
LKTEAAPKGWPAALLMFHLAMWRERFRNGLAEMEAGREFSGPPENVDELNDDELVSGIGTPLSDAAARSDQLLGEIIDLYQRLGERPMKWFEASNTTEAVLRNSYMHPRGHMCSYRLENGNEEGASKLFEDALTEMRGIEAPPIVMDSVLYNAACARARAGRLDEAIELLGEVMPRRADMRATASRDADLNALLGDERFKKLLGG